MSAEEAGPYHAVVVGSGGGKAYAEDTFPNTFVSVTTLAGVGYEFEKYVLSAGWSFDDSCRKYRRFIDENKARIGDRVLLVKSKKQLPDGFKVIAFVIPDYIQYDKLNYRDVRHARVCMDVVLKEAGDSGSKVVSGRECWPKIFAKYIASKVPKNNAKERIEEMRRNEAVARKLRKKKNKADSWDNKMRIAALADKVKVGDDVVLDSVASLWEDEPPTPGQYRAGDRPLTFEGEGAPLSGMPDTLTDNRRFNDPTDGHGHVIDDLLNMCYSDAKQLRFLMLISAIIGNDDDYMKASLIHFYLRKLVSLGCTPSAMLRVQVNTLSRRLCGMNNNGLKAKFIQEAAYICYRDGDIPGTREGLEAITGLAGCGLMVDAILQLGWSHPFSKNAAVCRALMKGYLGVGSSDTRDVRRKRTRRRTV